MCRRRTAINATPQHRHLCYDKGAAAKWWPSNLRRRARDRSALQWATRLDNAEEQQKTEISISEKPEVINPSANGEEEDKPADATEEEESHKPTIQEPEVQPQSPDTSELMGALSQNFDDF
ncbi:hypothetical protein Pelo_3767 [Pelomyxa schiedti]|nr:hypothetical protein Pelo_3767 [Pelomyxa schiedti]